jgi:16S rRNA (guanine966-N2)-methyltransferase
VTRIIAGRAGGRTLATPAGPRTRPTTDRVREALFSRLEALMDLDGAHVLDLYAGSGALGLEALSRGAATLLAVERHRPTAALITANARTLGMTGATRVRAVPVAQVLEAGPGQAPGHHLVLLDPPYDVEQEEVGRVLALLVDRGWLDPQAVLVLERAARSADPVWPPGLVSLGSRRYGETTVHLAEVTPDRTPGAATPSA